MDLKNEEEMLSAIDLDAMVPEELFSRPHHGDAHFFLGYHIPQSCPFCTRRSNLGYGRVYGGQPGDSVNSDGFFCIGNLDNFFKKLQFLYFIEKF